MIEDTGVPLIAGSEDDVRELVVLFIGVGIHFHVYESIDDIEWNDVSFEGVDVLGAANIHRPIVYHVLVVFYAIQAERKTDDSSDKDGELHMMEKAFDMKDFNYADMENLKNEAEDEVSLRDTGEDEKEKLCLTQLTYLVQKL